MKRISLLLFSLIILNNTYGQNKPTPVLKKSSVNSSNFLKHFFNQNHKNIENFNILALRVEFKEDDDPKTTGNGKFDLSENSDIELDPPPHDKLYFEDHLEALKRYYETLSRGKVQISYTVYPEAKNLAYTLPEKMSYYNPNTTTEQLNFRLAELFADALASADKDSTIDFSKYNTFVVFHAGAGADFQLEEIEKLNPTPHDLPSAYLYFDDLKNTIGNKDDDFKGIAVDNNSVYIENGLILPETESKYDSYGDFYNLGLNGIIAHQFGHHLGLPSLFNTETGRTAIGKFGLMDVGFANHFGFIPAMPSAWCRYFLGWEEAIVIKNGEKINVSEFYTPGNKIYRIDINASEYFLIENRQSDPDNDSLIVTKSPRNVILESDNYDWDIPGSGLLIWHIDENVIFNSYLTNTINSNPNHKGVALEEADGSEDIGKIFEGALPGFFTPENGQLLDAFFKEYVTSYGETVEGNTSFTPTTVPNSNSNNGAASHIYVTNITESDNIMSFDLRIDFLVDGFPYFIKHPRNTFIQPSNKGEIICIDTTSKEIYVWDNEGTPLYNITYNFENVHPTGQTEIFPVYVFGDYTDSKIRTIPIVQDFDNDGITEFMVGSFTGDFYLFKIAPNNPKLYKQIKLEPPGLSKIIMYGDNFIYVTDTKKIVSFDIDGNINWKHSSASDITNIALQKTDNKLMIVYSTSEGEINSIYQNSIYNSYKININEEINEILCTDLNFDNNDEVILSLNNSNIVLESQLGKTDFKIADWFKPTINDVYKKLSVGDINRDGALEIITYSNKYLYSFNRNGILLDNFPFELNKYKSSVNFLSYPLIGDINNDGYQEIIIATDDGEIWAIDYNGKPVSSFSFSTSGEVTNMILHKNYVDKIILSAISEDRFLYSWNLDYDYNRDNISLPSRFGDSINSSRIETESTFTPKELDSLMPDERVYNYPNPNEENFTIIRYYLTEEANINIKIFDLIGTLVSEFEGPGYPNTDNEVKWKLNGIPSGIYLARIEASGKTRKESKVIKIAVVK